MIEPLRPDVINPPAIVVQAFDEAQAIADIKAAVERRDEAKGEFKDAVLVIGQKLIEARRAMPGQPGVARHEAYSPAFLAFIERCGLTSNTASRYMSFARDPRRLERKRQLTREAMKSYSRRASLLREVRDLLMQAETLDDAITAIDEELNETR